MGTGDISFINQPTNDIGDFEINAFVLTGVDGNCKIAGIRIGINADSIHSNGWADAGNDDAHGIRNAGAAIGIGNKS